MLVSLVHVVRLKQRCGSTGVIESIANLKTSYASTRATSQINLEFLTLKWQVVSGRASTETSKTGLCWKNVVQKRKTIFLTGRQVAWTIEQSVVDFEKVELNNDDLKSFNSRWSEKPKPLLFIFSLHSRYFSQRSTARQRQTSVDGGATLGTEES